MFDKHNLINYFLEQLRKNWVILVFSFFITEYRSKMEIISYIHRTHIYTMENHISFMREKIEAHLKENRGNVWTEQLALAVHYCDTFKDPKRSTVINCQNIYDYSNEKDVSSKLNAFNKSISDE